jgi:hypothetical protein
MRDPHGRRSRRPLLSWFCPLWLVTLGIVDVSLVAGADTPPPGVEQILPRGRIAAVLDPRFVTAGQAEIPDTAWVLGVVVEGEAKAYSLNLLNRHEVVNDRSGDTDFAAVW